MSENQTSRESVELKPRPLCGLRIGVLGKGGAGKSTVTVLLARELARRGYEVCLLDADSSNMGIHKALGSEEAPVPLMEYFGGMVFSGGSVSCPVDDPTPLSNPEISLEKIPSRFVVQAENGIHLLSGGKMGALGPGGGCDGPIAKIARDLVVSKPGANPVFLADLKAGMEDSARGVLARMDLAVVVVDPTIASIGIAGDLQTMVQQIREGALPATEHMDIPAHVQLANDLFRETKVRGVMAILNRVPDVNTEVRLTGKVMDQAGLKPIGALREDSTVGSAWLEGSPLSSNENQSRISGIVDRMEEESRSDSGPSRAHRVLPEGAGQWK